MIKILPIEPREPKFKVVINYMIGDADGDITEELEYSREELEEELPLILALRKLKPLKRHWSVLFSNYPEDYPGEYIGVTEEEYALIMSELEKPKSYIGCYLYSERDIYWVSFTGIDITYIDENNAEHEVEIS